MGDSKKIHHSIALARDIIFSSSHNEKGCATVDLVFNSAFDLLCMEWVFTVLKTKRIDQRVIERLMRYYKDSITIPIVNNILGRMIKNTRLTLRQGDCPSSLWFGY